MSTAGGGEDSEVACYVLGYLLHENYSATATSFLKECRVLPTESLLVLPQTSLKTIITDHKAKHDSMVMLNTLGSATTFEALWTKLNKTLQQMKGLYDQVLSNQTGSMPQLRAAVRGHHRPPPSKARAKQITVSTATAAIQSKPATQRSIPPSVPSNPPTPGPALRPPTPGPAHSLTPPQPTPVYAPQVSPVKSHITPLPSSPHRRKPVPKRKLQTSSESEPVGVAGTSYAPPTSPTMHQILETFLEDDYLPGKLADIINKCVESESSASELSSTTLDSILSMTELEPAFEGLLQQTMAPGNSGPPHNTGAQHIASASNPGAQYIASTSNPRAQQNLIASTTIQGLQHNVMTPPISTLSNSGLQASPAVTSLVHPFTQAPSSSSTINHQTVAACHGSGSGSAASKSAVGGLDTGAEITSQQVKTMEAERSGAVTDFTGTTTTLHGTPQPGFSGYVEGQRSPLEQDGPPAKRAKVMTGDGGGGGFFPTDQDIDAFLDKLHRDSNTNDSDSN